MVMPRTFVCLALMLAVSACNRSTVCTRPEPANLWVEGSSNLNPDSAGDPLPTLVRVYQLSNLGELEQASFEQMMRTPERVLGNTLLATEDVTVYPGRSTFRSFERDPGANYVVGVAVVRQPRGDQWRAVLKMPSCGKKARARPMVRFKLDGYTIAGSIARDESPEGCDHEDSVCLEGRADG